MKSINSLNIKKFIISFNVTIIIFTILLLSLNLDVFYVSHASSGMIPVITYEIYSITETSFPYILIASIGISSYIFFTKRLNKWEFMRIGLLTFLSFISIIVLLLVVINPHFLILFPVGNAPTRIIEIFPSLMFIIILYIAFIANSILIIQYKRYLSK